MSNLVYILNGLTATALIILVILLLFTLDTGAWWKELKGLSKKQKIMVLLLGIIIWLVISILLGTLEISF